MPIDATEAAPEPAPASTGLKMTMTAKPKKALGATAAGFAAASELKEQAPKAEAVEELVEGSIGNDNEPLVIAAIGNTFHLGGAQHLRPGAQPAAEGEGEGVEAVLSLTDAAASAPAAAAPAEPAAAPAAPVDEDAEAAQALLSEVRKSGGASIFGSGGKVDEAEMYRLDVATRAEVADEDAYERMPIEQFGKAYLRGYNWKEGDGMGRNGEQIEAVEYVPRPQLLGLGAQPKEQKNHKADKKFIKPGESREAKKDMIYVDESGRQRHVKKVSEKLVEREKVGFVKDALVAITAGPHKGLYGRILSLGGLESKLRAQLRLTLNGEQVSVEVEALEPVKDAKLEKQRPGFTHEKAHAAEGGGKRDRDDEPEDRDRERDRERDRGERERDRDRDRGRERDRDRDRDERERKQHKSDKHHKRDKHHRSDKPERDAESGGGGRGGGRPWVCENIRVRVVDKRIKGGSLYSKKGVVADVSGGMDALALRMDGGALVEGVPASAVETALPKVGGAVLCVRGKHRNRRGRLLERHSEDAVAVVQLNEDFAIVKVDFDEVAEWVGVSGEDLEDDNL